MATTPTQNSVPSESPRDLKFNAGKIDEFVTSLALQYIDRFGKQHYTLEGIKQLAFQAIAAFGYITMDSFEDGATLTLPNQVLRWKSNGEYYRWDGVFPKTVAASSTPASTGGIAKGAWVAVGANAVTDMAKRAGAVANGIQDAINTSQPWQTVLTINNDETVTSLSNDYGVEIDARRGRILDASGVQLSTYAEPKSRFVTGREYLWAIHKRMINSNVSAGGTATVVWSGDSTTAGVNASPWDPASIANELRFTYGIPSVRNYNEGHSSKTMVDWGYWYVNRDIEAHPGMDCYVLRWGINDGGVTSYADFVKALRDGLTTLRTWKSVETLSVILMMPNTTSDTTTGKDEKWYEQISGALRQAARDFKCMFFDTYAIWRDARGYAPGAWLDDPYGDNRGIHPDYVFNAQIIGDVCELLYGPCASVNGKTNKFINSPSSIQQVTAAYPPSAFPYGIGLYRTDDANGSWPINGEITVKCTADGIVTQTLTGYLNNAQKVTFTRYGTRTGTTWSDFRGQSYDITSSMLSNSWTVAASRSATYQKSREGVVTINAMLVPGTVATGTTIMTLPADYRPKNVISYIACGANNGYASINILTNGQVQINSIPAGAAVLTINVTFPALVF
ncbi:TPA: GDSL-type esterase/lipase family protein [Enterobacter kobei]